MQVSCGVLSLLLGFAAAGSVALGGCRSPASTANAAVRASAAQEVTGRELDGIWRAEVTLPGSRSIVRFVQLSGTSNPIRRDTVGGRVHARIVVSGRSFVDAAGAEQSCVTPRALLSVPGVLAAQVTRTDSTGLEWNANADVLFEAAGLLSDDRPFLDSLRRTAARRWAAGERDSLAVRGPRNGWPIVVNLTGPNASMRGSIRVQEVGTGTFTAIRITRILVDCRS